MIHVDYILDRDGKTVRVGDRVTTGDPVIGLDGRTCYGRGPFMVSRLARDGARWKAFVGRDYFYSDGRDFPQLAKISPPLMIVFADRKG